ncbi:MAG TPA: F0F1 ATP synthase subunit epsilon [Tepidisphaeraceae bacterium]|jgi:F-type H+-transporting ATPase subunit epsilon|nr:F0F1 ATP synthase subunit epsilon [Tepidisphaeraceae bacterium]
MAFRCVVVTPEQQTLDEANVTQAILPAHDGLIGILTDRAPLLVKLGVGPLRIQLAGGQTRTYFIDGGIAQMKSNNLTILTGEATLPEDIDVDSARAEYAAAEARKATDSKAMEQREREMARGREKQKLAGRK